MNNTYMNIWQTISLLVLITLILPSCNLPQEDTSKYPDCKNTKFNKYCWTYCNMANTDSILIEVYQKGDKFHHLINENYYKITDKNLSPSTGSRLKTQKRQWSFKLIDSLDVNYDYRFVFQDNGAIETHELTELVIEPLPEMKDAGRTGIKVIYKCALGSFKIDGHKYYGGDFGLYY